MIRRSRQVVMRLSAFQVLEARWSTGDELMAGCVVVPRWPRSAKGDNAQFSVINSPLDSGRFTSYQMRVEQTELYDIHAAVAC